MNKKTERLYKAAKELKGVTGKTEVAKLLHITPQVLNNWEERGVSKQGLEEAQKYMGASARWVETGRGSMVAVAQKPAKQLVRTESKPVIYDDSIAAIVIMLARLDREARIKLIGKIEVWIEDVLQVKQNDRRDLLQFDRRNKPR